MKRNLRRRVMERDNSQCQKCDETEMDLHVHHKTPISEGGEDRPENLLTLCTDCHYKEHQHGVGAKVSWTETVSAPDVELKYFNPTDNAILDSLAEGRCTPTYIAEQRDYTRGNVKNRLDRLDEHGYVRRLSRGLYELAEDPRESNDG